MRLWSIHPRYLDAIGLVALWREGLLAQKVLRGETRGYRHHPQLERFRAFEGSVGNYLLEVCREAEKREYHFDRSKILKGADALSLPIPRGQLEYEFAHLTKKMQLRSPQNVVETPLKITPHPLFYEVEGEVCSWERGGYSL